MRVCQRPEGHYTEKAEWHQACGYSYLVMRSDGKVMGSKDYRGKNVVENFLNNILQEEVVMTAED